MGAATDIEVGTDPKIKLIPGFLVTYASYDQWSKNWRKNQNKSKTAETLGIGRKTLHRKLAEYGMEDSEE